MYRVIAAKLNVDVSRCQRLWRSSKSYALQFSSTASRFEHHHDHNADNQRANGVQESDVAIVGGGMVGMALACSLASSPLTRNVSIAIIDDNPALNARGLISKDALPDPRVSTITPASISFLQDIVAWKYIEQQGHAYFDKVQEKDSQKTVRPSRLASMGVQSGASSGKMDSRLAKLELAAGKAAIWLQSWWPHMFPHGPLNSSLMSWSDGPLVITST